MATQHGSGSTDEERQAEAERRRLYALGGLAQSYPPEGVADLLRRPPSRPAWRARPRRERLGMYAILALEAALGGLVVAGIAERSAAFVLVGALALVFLLMATAAVAALSELRRRTSDERRPQPLTAEGAQGDQQHSG